MNAAEIIKILGDLDFNKEDYWVVAGAAMVLHGIKLETSDIDLGCSTRLADALETKYQPVIDSDGARSFHLENDVEIFENWLADRIDFVSGIPVVSIEGLIAMKKKLGREKDLKDIALINKWRFNLDY